jgi:hypothetical protein
MTTQPRVLGIHYHPNGLRPKACTDDRCPEYAWPVTERRQRVRVGIGRAA